MLEMTIVDAVALGQKKDVEALIKAGKSVEQPDANGDRPVSLAAARNDFEILKLLVNAGAQLADIWDSYDRTPQMWAQLHENKDMESFIDKTIREKKNRITC